MTKRALKRIFIAVSLIALVAFACDFFERQKSWIEYTYYYIVGEENEPIPHEIRYYPESRRGYYQFDPQTILASLNRGKTDIFTPLSEEDSFNMDIVHDNIAWTQSDFLRVANVLSHQVWHEPLGLDNWDVSLVIFIGSCNGPFSGFYDFEITYYRIIKTGLETEYIARHISLMPWRGVAEWAGDGDFSRPFIFGWRNIELTNFKITAEQAVRIVGENGGKTAWANKKDNCDIFAAADENPNRLFENDWDVDYGIGTFSAFINPFTGEFYPTK